MYGKLSVLLFITFLFSIPHTSVVIAVGTCTYHAANPPLYSQNICVSCEHGGTNGIGQDCGLNPNQYTTYQPGVGGCNACTGIQAGTGYYYYSYYNSGASIIGGSNPGCSRDESIGSQVAYANPQQSNITECWWGATVPNACNRGYSTAYCSSGGGGGAGGGQCQETSGQGGTCPVNYRNRNCSDVPCAWREECSCTCDCDSQCQVGGTGQCQDAPGGGPTATPTPTPTPYCTLSCPGSSGSGGSGSGVGSGGSGTGTGGTSGGSIIPPYASGSLSYVGYNGFSCSTFDNGTTGIGSCPTSTGGLSGESWAQAATFNMLCGEQSQVYTAEVSGSGTGGATSGGTGAGGTSTPAPGTPTPTPTIGLYPQGCSLGSGGGASTPTPTTGTGAGSGSGSGSSSLSCSCSVTLGCQTSLQAPASDPSQESGSCNPGVCDFTVSPNFAAFNSELTIDIDHAAQMTQNTMSFSDNSATSDLGSATSTTHAFVNAGVYPITLTCSNGSTNITCTRNVNAYCNNGLVPTATPTPASSTSWFKLKNTSFSREDEIVNAIPASATAYDTDDDGICTAGQPSVAACLVSGSAGSVLSEGAISLGNGSISSVGWQKQSTVLVKRFTPTSFKSYALARKKTNIITDMSEIDATQINKFVGNMTVSNSDLSSATEDFVLLIDGDLTITDSLTNTADTAAVFVVTGTLKIANTVGEMDGIFITTNVDFSYDSTPSDTPLKIKGNLVSINPGDTSKRVRSNTDKPSIFVSGDSTKYTRVIGLLGINTYDQEEITQ